MKGKKIFTALMSAAVLVTSAFGVQVKAQPAIANLGKTETNTTFVSAENKKQAPVAGTRVEYVYDNPVTSTTVTTLYCGGTGNCVTHESVVVVPIEEETKPSTQPWEVLGTNHCLDWMNTTTTTYPVVSNTPTGYGTNHCVDWWETTTTVAEQPSIVTTNVSDFFTSIDNEMLIPEKKELKIKQYSKGELLFKNESGLDRLYVTNMSSDREDQIYNYQSGYYFDSKLQTRTNKLEFFGLKPGKTKVFISDEYNQSCIIELEVEKSGLPEINNKLEYYVDEDSEIPADDNFNVYLSEWKYLTFKNAVDRVDAYIVDPEKYDSDIFTLGGYTTSREGGVYQTILAEPVNTGTVQVLITDSIGQNRLVTLNALTPPPAPVITWVTDEDIDYRTTETFVTTTIEYCFTTVCTGTTPVTTTAQTSDDDFGEPTLPGDIDLNNERGLSDITVLTKNIVNEKLYPIVGKAAKSNADLNRNKAIDSVDLTMLIEANLGTIQF